jgi:integrase
MSKITTPAHRKKLKPRQRPYFHEIKPGVFVGCRRNPNGPDRWVAKYYSGNRSKPYRGKTIAAAPADDADANPDADLSRANKHTPLTFAQAVDLTLNLAPQFTGTREDGPLTVAEIMWRHNDQIHATKKSGPEEASAIEAWVIPFLGHKNAATLTHAELKRWLNKIASTGRKLRTPPSEPPRYGPPPATAEEKRKRRDSANRVKAILVAALNDAFREGLLPSDAAWRRLKSFENVSRSRAAYIESAADVRKFLLACAPDFQQIARGAIETGGRYGDLCRLNVGDFDARAGTITFRLPKGGKAYRVHLTDEGCAFFGDLASERARGEPMFLRADGKRWGRHHQIRPMRDAVERAGLDSALTFHSTRHSYASHLVMAGVPMAVVAKALGHTSTKMCEQHYGHLAPSYERETIRNNALRVR